MFTRLRRLGGRRVVIGSDRPESSGPHEGKESPISANFCHGLTLYKSNWNRVAFGLAIIADNLSKAGWSWGCVSALDSRGQTIFLADAHRGDGKRFVVRADEKLTAFLELESMIRNSQRLAAAHG